MLEGLVDMTRFVPSTANSQALTYRIIDSEEEKEKIFPLIGWAGALPDWDGPEEGERPSAYVLICCDLSRGKNKMVDNGIAAQTIMLGAVEQGFGGCMILNFKRAEAAEALEIDTEKYSLDLLHKTFYMTWISPQVLLSCLFLCSPFTLFFSVFPVVFFYVFPRVFFDSFIT